MTIAEFNTAANKATLQAQAIAEVNASLECEDIFNDLLAEAAFLEAIDPMNLVGDETLAECIEAAVEAAIEQAQDQMA